MPNEKDLDALLNTHPDEEGDEDEDENKNNEDEEEENEEGEDEEKGEGEGEEDEGQDEGEKEKEELDKETIKKFDKKSREDVMREFQKQEKKIKDLETKAKEKEEGDEEDEGKEKKKKGEEKETEEIKVPTDEELKKMTPKDFAKWVLAEVEKRVGKTYEERTSARDAAAREIKETQKDHPLLKTSSEYRELVLALIDTAAQKGKAIPLKEACEKIDAFIGKQKGDKGVSEEEKARLKKAKAQVESGKGAPPTPEEEKTAEQKRVEGIFGAGKSDSPLGGLGV